MVPRFGEFCWRGIHPPTSWPQLPPLTTRKKRNRTALDSLKSGRAQLRKAAVDFHCCISGLIFLYNNQATQVGFATRLSSWRCQFFIDFHSTYLIWKISSQGFRNCFYFINMTIDGQNIAINFKKRVFEVFCRTEPLTRRSVGSVFYFGPTVAKMM